MGYKDASSLDCINDQLCWYCGAPRYMMDTTFAFSFFMYLWIAAFIIACTQCIIAGAVGSWFFTPRGQKLTKPVFAVVIKNTLLWHLGSMAFGSFILAVVQFIKWMLRWAEKQLEAQGNKAMACVLKILRCLVTCFEKCVKFLNKNAYIQIAIKGKNFCRSAKNAFQLIWRNAARFFVVCSLSYIVHFIGWLTIMGGTTVTGWYILAAMKPDANVWAPMAVFITLSIVIAKVFMAVFGLAVATTLQCFIMAEEIGPEEVEKFVPSDLVKYINAASATKSSGCCGCIG